MIESFRCKDTQTLFEGGDPKRFRSFKTAAERKLTLLHTAVTLDFLRSPPGNRLGKNWQVTGPASGASASTSNGVSASRGVKVLRRMSRSLTTTEEAN